MLTLTDSTSVVPCAVVLAEILPGLCAELETRRAADVYCEALGAMEWGALFLAGSIPHARALMALAVYLSRAALTPEERAAKR